jgi:hypothetical protein
MSNNHPENFQFFHETWRFFEVFEVTGTGSSWILSSFQILKTGGSLILIVLQQPEMAVI